MYATILFSLLACTQMENPGDPFTPVKIAEKTHETPEQSIESPKTEEPVDPLFEPTGSVLIVSKVDEEQTEQEKSVATEQEEQNPPTEELSSEEGTKEQGVPSENSSHGEHNIVSDTVEDTNLSVAEKASLVRKNMPKLCFYVCLYAFVCVCMRLYVFIWDYPYNNITLITIFSRQKQISL